MDLQFVSQFMLQNFQQTEIKNNGMHFLARCPLCGDSKKSQYKKRFNLNFNNGNPGWHCFNCDRKGNFIELFSIIKGVSYDDAKKEIFHTWKCKEKTKEEYTRKKRIVDNPEKKKERNENNFNWIKENCYSIKDDNRYVKALKKFYRSRKISDNYIIYICYEGKYKNRIIIPIFDNDKNIIYFQARRIPGTGVHPKYNNPVSSKELCILNKYKFNKEKYIIVTEGIIDAFMIGNQGTSCLGKEVSKELINELLNYTDKDIIIALDNDEEAYKSLARFMKNNCCSKKVKYFLYPKKFKKYKDLNEIAVHENINIYDTIVENSIDYFKMFIQLKMKKLI